MLVASRWFYRHSSHASVACTCRVVETLMETELVLIIRFPTGHPHMRTHTQSGGVHLFILFSDSGRLEHWQGILYVFTCIMLLLWTFFPAFPLLCILHTGASCSCMNILRNIWLADEPFILGGFSTTSRTPYLFVLCTCCHA
jgi:hypothetical protein